MSAEEHARPDAAYWYEWTEGYDDPDGPDADPFALERSYQQTTGQIVFRSGKPLEWIRSDIVAVTAPGSGELRFINP